MFLEAGELNWLGTFFGESSKKDAYGNTDSEVFEDIGVYRGKLMLLRDSSKEIAKGFASMSDYEFWLRYRPSINDAKKVVIKGETYKVNGLQHDPAPQKLWTKVFLTSV